MPLKLREDQRSSWPMRTAASRQAGIARGMQVPLSCVGTCGGIVQNAYSSVAVANPAWTFARGDAQFVGSLLVPGGANGSTVAETQLNGNNNSSANSAIQSIGNLSTIEFTTGQSGDLSLIFDVLGLLGLGGLAVRRRKAA